jgi:hypothetical protein
LIFSEVEKSEKNLKGKVTLLPWPKLFLVKLKSYIHFYLKPEYFLQNLKIFQESVKRVVVRVAVPHLSFGRVETQKLSVYLNTNVHDIPNSLEALDAARPK